MNNLSTDDKTLICAGLCCNCNRLISIEVTGAKVFLHVSRNVSHACLCALGTNYYVYGKGNYYKEKIK